MYSTYGLFMSLIIGALAGYIANRLMDNAGGLLKNIVLGIVGGVVGGFVFRAFGLYAHGFIGTLIVSVVGACLCIWIGRKLF